MPALLNQRAVVLAKIESTYNTDPVPTAAANAVLVEDPAYSVDPNVLERNFSRPDLSRLPHAIGRKLASMTFMVEASTNGVSNLGVTSSTVGVLLRACGLSETAIDDAANGADVVKNVTGNSRSDVSWAVGGSEVLTEPVRYVIEVTTGGPSATAAVSITPDKNAIDNLSQVAQTGVTVTTAVALDLKDGGSGYTATPTFTGSLVAGDKYTVVCYPLGFLYEPVSEGFESVTLYAYFDGLLHKMTGARGNVSFEAKAGEYGKFTFTFTGQYIAPIDAALPTNPAFDQKAPGIFEQAQLRLDNYTAVVDSASWDLGNQIAPRSDANNSDGYNGVRITGRQPSGGIDPEADLVASEDFWGKMSSATEMFLRYRLGTVAGRKITMLFPSCQYSGLSYQDRENLRVFDAGVAFNGQAGNDEVSIFMH
jgi:hypothetical protein